MNRLYAALMVPSRAKTGALAPAGRPAALTAEPATVSRTNAVSSSRRTARATSPRSPRPARPTTTCPRSRRRSPAGCTSCAAPSTPCARTSASRRLDIVEPEGRRTWYRSPNGSRASRSSSASSTALYRELRGAARAPTTVSCSTSGPPPSAATPRPSTSSRCATRSIELDLATESLSHLRIPKVVAAEVRGLGRPPHLAPARGAARAVPLHRRRLPAQARGRGPGAHVRRRGRARADQPALPLRVARAAGQAPVDRVRLGHALRRGPRPPAGHLRQGRQLGRVDRERRRRQEALLGLRPRRSVDLGVDDHQRSGADAARLLPERRHRPELREVDPAVRARSRRSRRKIAAIYARRGLPRPRVPGRAAGGQRRPRAPAARRLRRRGPAARGLREDPRRHALARCAARCRPTSSRKTRRRTPASSRPSSRCA